MSTKKLLIVDDSRVSRMMIKTIVATHYPDVQIQEAGNGDECLQKVNDFNPDIAILDMNMPGMDGVDLGIELRKQFPDMLIYLLTANFQESTRNKASGAGIHFEKKPVTEEKILGILKQAE